MVRPYQHLQPALLMQREWSRVCDSAAVPAGKPCGVLKEGRMDDVATARTCGMVLPGPDWAALTDGSINHEFRKADRA